MYLVCQIEKHGSVLNRWEYGDRGVANRVAREASKNGDLSGIYHDDTGELIGVFYSGVEYTESEIDGDWLSPVGTKLQHDLTPAHYAAWVTLREV